MKGCSTKTHEKMLKNALLPLSGTSKASFSLPKATKRSVVAIDKLIGWSNEVTRQRSEAGGRPFVALIAVVNSSLSPAGRVRQQWNEL
jgi:hypothetical protein